MRADSGGIREGGPIHRSVRHATIRCRPALARFAQGHVARTRMSLPNPLSPRYRLVLGTIGLASLLTYVGGPLFVATYLQSHLGNLLAFAVTAAPLFISTIATTFALQTVRGPFDVGMVLAGLVGLGMVGAMNVFLVWQFAIGKAPAEPALFVCGAAIWVVVASVYLWLAMRPSLRDTA